MTRRDLHVKMSSIALHRSILLDFDLPILADLASEQEFMLTDWLIGGSMRSRVVPKPSLRTTNLSRNTWTSLWTRFGTAKSSILGS